MHAATTAVPATASPVCAGCGKPKATSTRAGRCRCAERDVRRAAATALAAAEVATVVKLVRRVDPAVSAATTEAALDLIAGSRQKRRRLITYLIAHPQALTSGSSQAPKSLGQLVAALVNAGATGLLPPRCAGCGQPEELLHTSGADRICRRCYEHQRVTTEVCGECGKRCRAHGRTPDGAPRCQSCQHKARTQPCSRCGRTRPVTYNRTDNKPYCRGCRARNSLAECAGCGRQRPVNSRGADGSGYCGSCYAATRAPHTTCSRCGTTGPVASRNGDRPLCFSCYRHPSRTCGVCGRTRRVALRATAASPDICPTCYQAPQVSCSVCGEHALGRRGTADGKPMCFTCQATRRVNTALTAPDGTIPKLLIPLRDAIAAADNPRSTLSNFIPSTALALLSNIASGQRPLSHQSLDEQPFSYSIEHLRALLVAAGALPARDEHLTRLQRYATDLAANADDPDDRRLLARFARWHTLARLHRRTTTTNLTPNAAYRARAELAAAARFLDFLHTRSRPLGHCRQADIDAWFARRRHTQESRAFLTWARRQRLISDLDLPAAQTRRPHQFTRDDDRWALAHNLLHNESSASIADRVAACLVLLYAQPVARIATLTREHVQTTEDGAVQLHLGHTDVVMLHPLDQLLTQLPVDKPRGMATHLNSGNWLFPGRRPGQPLHTDSLAHRMRALGLNPRPDRNAALLQLARELPPTVIGKLLGLHPGTAAQWAQTAGSPWARYAATHSRRH